MVYVPLNCFGVAPLTAVQGEQAVSALKIELHSLVDELNALSMRNDELVAEREQDAEAMNEMEAKVEEYKRKYDAVRIELRNLKGLPPF